MGVIGEHDEGFPIDNLSLTHDHTLLVSSSQSSCKFWSTEEIPKMATQKEKEEEDGEEDEERVRRRRKRKRKRPHMWSREEEQTKKDDFFVDL